VLAAMLDDWAPLDDVAVLVVRRIAQLASD
jgi:hypothetical protein